MLNRLLIWFEKWKLDTSFEKKTSLMCVLGADILPTAYFTWASSHRNSVGDPHVTHNDELSYEEHIEKNGSLAYAKPNLIL